MECYHSPRQYGEPCVAGYPCGPNLVCKAGMQQCGCANDAGCPNGLKCYLGIGNFVLGGPQSYNTVTNVCGACGQNSDCAGYQRICSSGGANVVGVQPWPSSFASWCTGQGMNGVPCEFTNECAASQGLHCVSGSCGLGGG
jgi:hypothetical protein